jgi:hypothetical protein
MTTETATKTTIPQQLDPAVFVRLLEEGYGAGAWHGADLRAALADVSPRTAFWRPAPGRHNIAEIALHHAWCVRGAIGQLAGEEPAVFPLDGSDWFSLSDDGPMTWPDTVDVVDAHQRRLAAVVADIGAGRITSPLPVGERFDLVLGVTCHAIYHAGQVQLVKALGAARPDDAPRREA